jgi:hypothetical protein
VFAVKAIEPCEVRVIIEFDIEYEEFTTEYEEFTIEYEPVRPVRSSYR